MNLNIDLLLVGQRVFKPGYGDVDSYSSISLVGEVIKSGNFPATWDDFYFQEADINGYVL